MTIIIYNGMKMRNYVDDDNKNNNSEKKFPEREITQLSIMFILTHSPARKRLQVSSCCHEKLHFQINNLTISSKQRP